MFDNYIQELPLPCKPYSVEKWKQLVEKACNDLAFPEDNKIKISDMTLTEYKPSDFYNGTPNHDILKWRYLVESCAAGLPYLRTIVLNSPPGVPGLGKLLVVDVGAGSTDIGYMLRTISVNSSSENLLYFTPAPTCPIAGNKLTE